MMYNQGKNDATFNKIMSSNRYINFSWIYDDRDDMGIGDELI